MHSEITIAPTAENADLKRIKPGQKIYFKAEFRDFIGNPTGDTGDVRISTTKGIIRIHGIESSSSSVLLEDGSINSAGKLVFEVIPGNDFGPCRVLVSSEVGHAYSEFEFPKPQSFAPTEIMESVIYAFLFAILIRIFFFQTFWIPTGSMEPTLFQGDRIVVNKMIYRTRMPHRGEIVVFKVFQPHPKRTHGYLTLDDAVEAMERYDERMASVESSILANREQGDDRVWVEVQDYIKRVVGLPGDVVEVIDGVLYINELPLEQNYEIRQPDYRQFGPVTVPPGEIFVLGDNRSNSQDSHVIGTIPIRNLEGRAELIFWPPPRMKVLLKGGE
ncbi:MAG TPA: signal peptidase I [bacterium]|jgi:signal peptidase I